MITLTRLLGIAKLLDIHPHDKNNFLSRMRKHNNTWKPDRIRTVQVEFQYTEEHAENILKELAELSKKTLSEQDIKELLKNT